MLEPGDKAPEFTLLDQHESSVSLADFRGRRVLVYFYPKADTPGCTTQACSVRDAREQLGDVTVLGISPDSPSRQRRFDYKYGLGFRLLADEEHTVAESYGVWGEKSMYGRKYMGIIRAAFLIDDNGLVEQAWYKIAPKETIPALLRAINNDGEPTLLDAIADVEKRADGDADNGRVRVANDQSDDGSDAFDSFEAMRAGGLAPENERPPSRLEPKRKLPAEPARPAKAAGSASKAKPKQPTAKASAADADANPGGGNGGSGATASGDLPEPRDILPHRLPFLFVDKLTELEPGLRAKGSWTLTGVEVFFAGHFPDRPILPGVLIVEAIAQLGAIAVLTDDRFKDKLPLFGGINSARFRRIVQPGDTLEMEVELGHMSARMGKGHGTATVDGEAACEVDLMFILADKE